jgi:outer membrane protein assembly factor BamB
LSFRRLCSALAAVSLLATGASLFAVESSSNWPQFRGPGSLGVADNSNLPDHWSTNENVAWKIQVPGRGWSSPIVWGNRVFLTTVITSGELEPPKKGLYMGGDRQEIPKGDFRFVTLCYDLKTGAEHWLAEARHGAAPTPIHLKNSYASSTPVTDGERIFVNFGGVGLFCYDLEGRPLWSTNSTPLKMRNGWGSAASPVLHEGRLFIVNDNDDQSFLLALDAKTGRQLWRVSREEKSNWATPYVWQNEMRAELITPGTTRIRSYDLSGVPLWECGGMSSIVIPTPFSKFGLLYVASGYVADKVRPVFAIKPGASGDISLRAGETNNQYIQWHQPIGGPYNPSPLVYGDYFYVLFDFGFLSCQDARTGRPVYEKQRVRESNTAFTASPWAANGKIFALGEDGDTFVFQAGPNYKLLHQNSLGEMCMATPAIAEDQLLIRTANSLFCIRQQLQKK